MATTAKLRHEFEQRANENADAVSVLHNHQHLWRSVGGPEPDALFRPSTDDIENASRCCETLCSMAKADDRDGLAEFSQEITRAVGNLKSVEWEDIRKEKYFLTPPGLFSELVRTATSLISRQSAEITRRQEWLTADPGVDETREIPIGHGGADRYGIDLEEFKMKTGRKPRGWKKAVQIAEWFTYNRHVHESWVEGDGDAIVASPLMFSSPPLLSPESHMCMTHPHGCILMRCERYWSYTMTALIYKDGRTSRERHLCAEVNTTCSTQRLQHTEKSSASGLPCQRM